MKHSNGQIDVMDRALVVRYKIGTRRRRATCHICEYSRMKTAAEAASVAQVRVHCAVQLIALGHVRQQYCRWADSRHLVVLIFSELQNELEVFKHFEMHRLGCVLNVYKVPVF